MNAVSANGWAASLNFDNRFIAELPGDAETENTRRQVHGACYSPVNPLPVAQPHLLACSQEAAELLDLTPEDCRSSLFVEVFSGTLILPGMSPHALCYGGHQFGSWAGQLGDGRAINLAEVVNRRNERWIMQLKGAGPTPYSRAGDGFAVLRSSLREFLCSEAMHHLGIPTTRALSLTLTGTQVVRDMFYDGNPQPEPGAVVCRLAPSFLRFGNFELLAARAEHDLLKRLVDYTITTDFAGFGFSLDRHGYLAWFTEICRRTMLLAAEWMRVGFVHGVLNTDNMSILGLTIDYGPYGWLEPYDQTWTPNTTDAHGRRYCFGNQPQIVLWNLTQLANALFPLIGQPEPLQETLNDSWGLFQRRWRQILAAKFGLSEDRDDHRHFMLRTLTMLTEDEIDYTIFFRQLAEITIGDQPIAFLSIFADALYRPLSAYLAKQSAYDSWLNDYRCCLRDGENDNQRRKQTMNLTNPKFVFRNYLAQLAIDKAEQGDPTGIEELLTVLRHPYDEQPGYEQFAARRPDWAANRPGCSMLSCSS